MSLTAAEISYYERFAERLADAAAVAIQPYFRAQLAVDDKGDAAVAGRRYDPVTIADMSVVPREVRDGADVLAQFGQIIVARRKFATPVGPNFSSAACHATGASTIRPSKR